MERLDIYVDDLLLDRQNPRLGYVESQSEALQAIIDLDHKHFRTMMESIRDNGLDPGDAFYVILSEDERDYVVLDGNRRLCALKVLRQPALLQAVQISEVLKKRLTEISDEFDPKRIETASCILFDDRETANAWILRRHGRGLSGEERIHWGTLEIQRFQNDRTILDIIDFVGRNNSFTADRWDLVKDRVEKKTSVLRRFIESKQLRQLLGLQIVADAEHKIPQFTLNAHAALDLLAQIFSDIADGDIDTRTHNKAGEIAGYIADLVGTRELKMEYGVPVKFSDIDLKKPKANIKPDLDPPASRPKKSQVRPPRPNLGYRKLNFAQPPSEKGKRLFYEASKIRLGDTPLASAYILRAVLEHTLDVYMNTNGLPRWDPKKNGQAFDLKQRATQVIDHLVQSGSVKRQELRGVERVLTNSDHPASIQALNDYHHDRFMIPSADDIRAAWDASESLFAAVYGPAS